MANLTRHNAPTGNAKDRTGIRTDKNWDEWDEADETWDDSLPDTWDNSNSQNPQFDVSGSNLSRQSAPTGSNLTRN
jgi:hypothetical protein